MASIQFSVSDDLYNCELKDLLPYDDFDSTSLHDDNAIVMNTPKLVNPIDNWIDSSSKFDLSPPSVTTCDLSKNVLSCNRGSQMLFGYNGGDRVHDSFEFDMLPTSVNSGDDQFACQDDLIIEELCDVINEPQFSNGNDIIGHVVSHAGSLIRGMIP